MISTPNVAPQIKISQEQIDLGLLPLGSHRDRVNQPQEAGLKEERTLTRKSSSLLQAPRERSVLGQHQLELKESVGATNFPGSSLSKFIGENLVTRAENSVSAVALSVVKPLAPIQQLAAQQLVKQEQLESTPELKRRKATLSRRSRTLAMIARMQRLMELQQLEFQQLLLEFSAIKRSKLHLEALLLELLVQLKIPESARAKIFRELQLAPSEVVEIERLRGVILELRLGNVARGGSHDSAI
jgi:hypothetical protein